MDPDITTALTELATSDDLPGHIARRIERGDDLKTDVFADQLIAHIRRATERDDGSAASQIGWAFSPREIQDADWSAVAVAVRDKFASRPQRPYSATVFIRLSQTFYDLRAADDTEAYRNIPGYLDDKTREVLERAGWDIEYDAEDPQLRWQD